MNTISGKDVWGRCTPGEGNESCFVLGALRIFVRIVDSEVHVAHDYGSVDGESPLQASEEEVVWSRWVIRGEPSCVRLEPCFPDRAVVVRPDMPFHLPKGGHAKIYVRVPLWVKVIFLGQQESLLTTIPTSVLSNTWFGNFEDGDLCYWLSSGFRQQDQADVSRPDLVICPLRIFNRSNDDFSVGKICLRLDNYSLFYDNVQLWSDEIRVLYKGPENISQVKVVGQPPEESPDAVLVSKPKKEIRNSFAAITFASLKERSGLGIQGQG